ncbi:MAG TPA: efflux RND transporter periplasmic adaptor subunit, partial [Salinimicrobium sp.]|nr:efflux RND transporter periplasmic adaptor subunit [Salinimicrobium sp.]
EGKPANYSPFRPGMTATVDIITNKKEDVIAVPISAILIKNDTTAIEGADSAINADSRYEAVFVKKGDEAELRKVKTGIQDNTNIEILSGLEVGDEVITGPYSTVTKSLNDGDKVEVMGSEEEVEE